MVVLYTIITTAMENNKRFWVLVPFHGTFHNSVFLCGSLVEINSMKFNGCPLYGLRSAIMESQFPILWRNWKAEKPRKQKLLQPFKWKRITQRRFRSNPKDHTMRILRINRCRFRLGQLSSKAKILLDWNTWEL